MLQNKYIIFFYKKFYASPFLLQNADISTCRKFLIKNMIYLFRNILGTSIIFATFYMRVWWLSFLQHFMRVFRYHFATFNTRVNIATNGLPYPILQRIPMILAHTLITPIGLIHFWLFQVNSPTVLTFRYFRQIRSEPFVCSSTDTVMTKLTY